MVAAGLCVAGLMLLSGCGGSGGGSTSSAVPADQIQEARQQGEEKAEERDRVAALQRQVRSIKRRLRHHAAHQAPARSAPAAVASTDEASARSAPSEDPIRSFHAPSGNVSCEVFGNGATCTVDSIGETFVLEADAPARTEAAAVLPRDLGELVEYGNTVTVGSITCEVPPSDVPRGITCVDQSDGHGFEASRITSRQAAY